MQFIHEYSKTGRGHKIIAMDGDKVVAEGPVAGYKSPAKLELDGATYICFNEVFASKGVPVDIVLSITAQPTTVKGVPASQVVE